MITFEFRRMEAWIQGADRFPRGYRNEVHKRLDPVVKQHFDKTQARVHVITGQLKASGTMLGVKLMASGTAAEGGFAYTVDYAKYELGRGGEHDFLTQPTNEMMPQYEDVLGAAFQTVMGSWR